MSTDRFRYSAAQIVSTPLNFLTFPSAAGGGRLHCHTHIHDDPEKFPILPRGRIYNPELAHQPEEYGPALSAQGAATIKLAFLIVTPTQPYRLRPDNSPPLFRHECARRESRAPSLVHDKTPARFSTTPLTTSASGHPASISQPAALNDALPGPPRFRTAVETAHSSPQLDPCTCFPTQSQPAMDHCAIKTPPLRRPSSIPSSRLLSRSSACRQHGLSPVRSAVLCADPLTRSWWRSRARASLMIVRVPPYPERRNSAAWTPADMIHLALPGPYRVPSRRISARIVCAPLAAPIRTPPAEKHRRQPLFQIDYGRLFKISFQSGRRCVRTRKRFCRHSGTGFTGLEEWFVACGVVYRGTRPAPLFSCEGACDEPDRALLAPRPHHCDSTLRSPPV